MADIPAPLTYGTITGRFISFGADSADAGAAPDIASLNGTVTIVPNVRVARVAASNGLNYIGIQTDITAKIVNGILYGPDGLTALTVLATDTPGLDTENMQYTASFQLQGVAAQPDPITFPLPGGTEVDLATVLNLPPTPAVQTVVLAGSALDQRITDVVTEMLGDGGEVSDVALTAHINSSTPHPAYDVDAPSFKLIFENGTV